MNSWKLNSTASHSLRVAIKRKFNIHFTEVYRKVKSIDDDIITADDGKKYQLTLKEIL